MLVDRRATASKCTLMGLWAMGRGQLGGLVAPPRGIGWEVPWGGGFGVGLPGALKRLHEEFIKITVRGPGAFPANEHSYI